MQEYLRKRRLGKGGFADVYLCEAQPGNQNPLEAPAVSAQGAADGTAGQNAGQNRDCAVKVVGYHRYDFSFLYFFNAVG